MPQTPKTPAYKRDAALRALSEPPDPDTNNHPESWYTSEAIIECTDRYVKAQQAYERDPGDATKAAMDTAAEELVQARREHREHRPSMGVMAGHPVEVVHALRRVAGRTPEQISKQLRMDEDEVRRILRGGEG